jgi:transcriptional regulator with GAF, ATPase, and Fis domain/tetratricopeptide (TPR) repeat protein
MVAWRNRYAYVRELGEGASGRVLLVHDLESGGTARALKVCRAEERERLLIEHRHLTAVTSEAVVRVHELLTVTEAVPAPFLLPRGALVLVEDVAPGQVASSYDLAHLTLVQRSEFLWSLTEGALRGLDALHQLGLVHADIKPDNLHCDDQGRGVVLLDLGLCRSENERDVVRGTPRMLAPEAWLGVCSTACDIYALGATLYDLACDRPMTESAGLERDSAHLQGVVDTALVSLIALFLQADPAHRPTDAPAALEAAYAVRGRALPAGLLHGAPRRRKPHAHIGHITAQQALTKALGGPGVVVVRGAAGSGRSHLIRTCVQSVQRDCAARAQASPSLVRGYPARAVGSDALSIVWLEDAQRADLAWALRADELGAVGDRQCTYVLETDAFSGEEIACETIDVGPLDSDAVAALLAAHGEAAATPALRLAIEACGAYAGRICRLVQRAQRSAVPFATLAQEEARQLAEGIADGLSADARTLLQLLAFGREGEPLVAALETRWAPSALGLLHSELRAAGAFSPGSALTLRRSVALTARAQARRSLTPAQGKALVDLLPEGARSPWAHALSGDVVHAQHALLACAETHRHAGEVVEALDLLDEACDTFPLHIETVLAAADAGRALGHYAAAALRLEVLDDARAATPRLELKRLRGDALGAVALGKQLLKAHADSDALLPLLARSHFDLGQYGHAEDVLDAIRDGAPLATRVRGAEVRVLLALASGDAHGAEKHSRQHLHLARELADPRQLARALALGVQTETERTAAARRQLAEAVVLARAAGEAHETATFALNLALWDLEDGDLGSAHTAFEQAATALLAVDRPRDRLRVLANYGVLMVAIGDVRRASHVLATARGLLTSTRDPDAALLVALCDAECAQREGRIADALDTLLQAASVAPSDHGQLFVACLARSAHLHALLGDLQAASAALGRAAECLRPSQPAEQAELAIARLRCGLVSGDLETRRRSYAALAAIDVRGVALELRLRAVICLHDAAALEADDRARLQHGAHCRELLERAMRGLPPALRVRMRSVPEYARVLSESFRRVPLESGDGGGRSTRELLRATRHFHAIEDPRQLARSLADTALRFIHAERALVIAEVSPETWRIVASAGSEQGDEARSFSHTLVERVFERGDVLVTMDARADVRLTDARSLHVLPMRSVLVAPAVLPHGRTVLYLDDRLRSSAFGPPEQALAEDLVDLFGRALTATQAVQRERQLRKRARREAHALSEALSLSQRAAPGSEAASGIVGRSPALVHALDLTRRVAQSDLSVLFTGESGTGKELFARQLHRESTRATRPFVAESCAALPDTLLESALFGHVRGAFTGAERARRGLFELADGGTLFLDEVGEMSPAMQAKLLRVLQTGELRPLGSEKTRVVNVRVVAATSRDLARAKDAGTFREDLYYRLAVVTVRLPALRERREDIPLLVAHLLRTLGSPMHASRAALAALQRAEFPGNVRELANVVQRAVVLSSGPTIEPEHLGLETESRVQEPARLAPATGLHGAIDALTERLVRVALDATDHNVTRAAERLGISRFGLQKIIKRLDLQRGG